MCCRTIKTKICEWDEGEVRQRSFIRFLLLLQILNFLFDPTMNGVLKNRLETTTLKPLD